MVAKCFAISSPIPVLHPMTATVLPERSALTTGGREIEGMMLARLLCKFGMNARFEV